MGTAPYMSSEQISGEPVEARTDIWSFGCLLYEMLTARRPFEGESFAAIASAVLSKEPDWTRLPEHTPDALRRLLRRTLQKDPNRRLRSIADARFELEEAASPILVAARPNERPRPHLRRLLPWIVVSLIAGLLVGVAIPDRDGYLQPRIAHLEIDLQDGLSPWNFDRALTVSPDDRHVVYSTPAWSTSGEELFYRAGQSTMAVRVRTEPELTAERPRELFSGEYRREPLSSHRVYDVSPDGERFLMIKFPREVRLA